MQPLSPIMAQSPCVDICRMDPSRDVCAGCWRTLDEIARWSEMTEAEQVAVLAAVARRREVEKLPK